MAHKEPASGSKWLQHTLRSAPWRRQSQLAAMIALTMFVSIIIGAMYLAQATTTSTTGRQMEDMVAYRERLVRENEQIRADIAQMRSIPRLLRRAQALGFSNADREQIEYLVIDGYMPELPESVAPLQPDAELLPVYDETFSGWLSQQWETLMKQFEQWVGSNGPQALRGQ